MSIRKRPAKKAKNGFTYQVYFPYVDATGVRQIYIKSGFADKKTAKEFETKKKEEIQNYGALAVNDNKTVDEAFADAIKIADKTLAQATKTYYQATYKDHIKDSLGKRKIITVRYSDLQNLINDESNSYSTAKNIKKVLNVIFKYALKQGLVRENIVKLTTLDIKNNEDSNSRYITKEQIEIVLKELTRVSKYGPKIHYTEWINQNYAIAIKIAMYTGLRVSEVLALSKDDFDLENDTITVNKRLEYHGLSKDELHVTDTMKTMNSKAIIPLVQPLKNVLIKWFEMTPFQLVVADINGNYIMPSTMNTRFNYVSKKVGFRFTFHMLRHYYSSKLEEMKLDPEERKNLLRHSQIEMTSHYTHMGIEQKKRAAFAAFNEKGHGNDEINN